jgi:hypothetical protein
MKFSRLSLLCFILSGTSAITTSAIAGPFEDTYLNTNPHTGAQRYVAAQKYGIVADGEFTTEWNAFIQSREVGEEKDTKELALKANDALSAARYLAHSHRNLITINPNLIAGTGTDKPTMVAKSRHKNLACDSIDMLAVATQLVSKKISVVQKATVQTNQHYLDITFTKGRNLVARQLGVIDIVPSKRGSPAKPGPDLPGIFNLLCADFNLVGEGKNGLDHFVVNAENTLRANLVALTLWAYQSAFSGSENAFTFLSRKIGFVGIVTALEGMVKNYSSFLHANTVLTKKYTINAHTIYFNDPEQLFFNSTRPDGMLSAPRALYFSTWKTLANSVSKEIYAAGSTTDFKGVGTLMKEEAAKKEDATLPWGKLSRRSHDRGFTLRSHEERQSIFVVLSIERHFNNINTIVVDPSTKMIKSGYVDKKTVASDILFAMGAYAPRMTTDHAIVTGGVVENIFLTERASILYQPRATGKKEGKTEEERKAKGGDPSKNPKPKVATPPAKVIPPAKRTS